jgi:hypothetical protein
LGQWAQRVAGVGDRLLGRRADRGVERASCSNLDKRENGGAQLTEWWSPLAQRALDGRPRRGKGVLLNRTVQLGRRAEVPVQRRAADPCGVGLAW